MPVISLEEQSICKCHVRYRPLALCGATKAVYRVNWCLTCEIITSCPFGPLNLTVLGAKWGLLFRLIVLHVNSSSTLKLKDSSTMGTYFLNRTVAKTNLTWPVGKSLDVVLFPRVSMSSVRNYLAASPSKPSPRKKIVPNLAETKAGGLISLIIWGLIREFERLELTGWNLHVARETPWRTEVLVQTAEWWLN